MFEQLIYCDRIIISFDYLDCGEDYKQILNVYPQTFKDVEELQKYITTLLHQQDINYNNTIYNINIEPIINTQQFNNFESFVKNIEI